MSSDPSPASAPAFDAQSYWTAALAGPHHGATALVGFEVLGFDIGEGRCEAAFCLPEAAANPGGWGQGGLISACLDEVMSVAASLVQDGPAMAPTLQMTTSYVRPVPVGTRFTGKGWVVRRGRAQIFTGGELLRGDGAVMATASAVCIPRLFDHSASAPASASAS